MMRRCSVETSGTKPTISTEVPFAYGLKDGRGILRQEDNAHSLKITKGGALVLWKNDFMTLGRNYDKLTLELFAKCTDEKGGVVWYVEPVLHFDDLFNGTVLYQFRGSTWIKAFREPWKQAFPVS